MPYFCSKFDVCRYDGSFGAMFEQFLGASHEFMYVFRGRWGTIYQHQPTFRGGFASQHLNIFPTFRGEMPNIQYQPLGESKTIFSVNLRHTALQPYVQGTAPWDPLHPTGQKPSKDQLGLKWAFLAKISQCSPVRAPISHRTTFPHS